MENHNSYEFEINLIVASLHDVHTLHGVLFDSRALRLTAAKLRARARHEGISFLTKTLPRLGKALDKALAENEPLNCVALGFKPLRNTTLPQFMGEFFKRVLAPDGTVLQDPCNPSIAVLRNLLYCFYKYEIPYTADQEQAVLSKFEKTEEDLASIENNLWLIATDSSSVATVGKGYLQSPNAAEIARKARHLLTELFASFDPTDIIPRHGPGAVATRQKLAAKYCWTNVSNRIRSVYPFEEYFFSSWNHVFDRYNQCLAVDGQDLPARVVLVPKDSRGPRLISCEPVDFQWVQQGLARSIVRLVESHPLTADNVHFTNQQPNQFGALLGSERGRYATLDLNEASDRVSVALVHTLFPDGLIPFLDACRTSATELPDGRLLYLRKFAPMGSALCFPILALTVWSILSAAAPDGYTRERILVYGDDVVVPTAFAENAMATLESFGLKINRDKSCYRGLFRESCGVDAFKGVNVTPVRFRTVWCDSPSPESYTSWIAYANSLYDKKYYNAYDTIVGRLHSIYGVIPGDDMHLPVPSLRVIPDSWYAQFRHRSNRDLQRREFYVRDVESKNVDIEIDGWSMLLRYLTESRSSSGLGDVNHEEFLPPFSVRSYTERRRSILRRRWR